MGSVERVCTSNENWTDDDPQCSIVQCNIKDLDKIANGYYVLNANNEPHTGFATYLQTASIVCTQGFRLVWDSTATCTSNGTWSKQTASCNIVTCLAPRETADVKYKIWLNTSYGSFVNAFPFGAISEVICEKGILKAGLRIRHCTIDGFWDGYDPVCAVIGVLGGGLAIAAIAAAGAFLFHFLRGQRKKSKEADLYTSVHAQQASNVEKEYAKIQETVVT